MFVIESPFKLFQCPTFIRAHPPSGAQGSRSQTQEVVAGNVERVDYTQEWIVLTPIHGQYTDERERVQIMISIDV